MSTLTKIVTFTVALTILACMRCRQAPADTLQIWPVFTGFEDLTDNVRLQPGNAKAQFNLANALQAAGDTADAVPRYEAALKLQPDYAEAHSNLAFAMRGAGDLAGALDHMQAAARLQPQNWAIAANLLVLLTEAGRCQDAMSLVENVRTLSAAAGRADAAETIDQAIKDCRGKSPR